MADFNKTVQHIVELTGYNEDTITKRIRFNLPIFGVKIVTFRELESRGYPYQISDESYEKLVIAIKKAQNRALR